MIEVCGVCKRIEDSGILNGISFHVQKGSIFGLIGPNGAGKTSLIKTITGVWRPDKGSISINGCDILKSPAVKETLGYVPEQSHYYDSFRVREMTVFYKLAYKNFSDKRFEEVNRILGIPLSKRVRELSKGTKAKLSLLLNLSILPEVLILDEPTSGLDPIAKRRFMEIILDDVAERKTTLLISTHNLGDVEKVCDNIAVIDKGEIRFSGTVDDMKHKVRKLQVVFSGGMPEDILKRKDILHISSMGSVYHIVTEKYSEELEKYIRKSGATLVEEMSLSLEEIFIYSLGGGDINEITG